eukprot:CAMPEP_0171198664 /NCGR_PEP_ID=MMETSP0790-20130122/23060_1 /TAXON_ID=2925 /ORGANISM="Alexandrium catenella, Strain OF101" /LENGTH=341 /DNA_ID=CAMNT_0011663977 /DNA_START=170 /DNA_END=1195 /DNA_ORIENTATION=-
MSSFPEGRFYEPEFPELDDVVVVQVKRIVAMGAYVSLLEYDGKEGMVLLSELSKRRIRSVSKLLRVGRTEICMILRVDKDKGYIDLSKRRVEPEDASAKEESFAKAKAVHGIMRHVASMNNIEVEDLCMKVSWPLYANKKFQDAHDALKQHINGEINVWAELDFTQPGKDLSDLAEKIKADIDIHLRRRLVQQTLRLRAKIEVSCSEYEGIDAVRAALKKGLEVTKEDCDIKINLVAHPLFVVTCTCKDKVMGMAAIEECTKAVEDAIKEKGGVFEEKSRPVLIGQDDKPEGDEEGSESGSDSDGSEGPQDETMGDLDEQALKDLMDKTKDLKVDDEEDDK